MDPKRGTRNAKRGTAFRIGLLLVLGLFLAPSSLAQCNYSLSPVDRQHGYSGVASAYFTVNAETNCTWSVSNPNSWITFTNTGLNSGTNNLYYSVSSNSSLSMRTGIVTVAGQTFTITQLGVPCNISLNPTMRNHGARATNSSFGVSVSTTGCTWTASVSNFWIHLTGATAGTNTGTVNYHVDTNNTPVSRTGYVAVAGANFLLTQSGANCQYDISPTNRLHGYAGSMGTNTVTLIGNGNGGNCAWFVVNTNPWITISPNAVGTNAGTFTYTVAPNPDAFARVGTFYVWDVPFQVVQSAAPCSPNLTPTSTTVSADPGTVTIGLNIPSTCAWAFTNAIPWITMSPASGVGPTNVSCTVTANPAQVGRTGTVYIADKTFVVRQDPAICTYSLSPTNRNHGYSAITASFRLNTLSICPWTVVNSNSWITFPVTNGLGTVTNLSYSVTANNGAINRTGTVVVAGQTYLVTQDGLGCAVNVSPGARTHGGGFGSNAIIITIASSCPWAAINTNSWLHLLGSTSGTGSYTNGYLVDPNPTAFPRSGFITVNEGVSMITQSGASCDYSLSAPSTNHSSLQETGSVTITAPLGCDWSVSNTNPWVALLSPASGNGSSTVFYVVSTNLNTNGRSGVLVFSGTAFTGNFTINQGNTTCTYKLSPATRNHGPGGAINYLTVIVSNPCPWQLVNTNPWITILSNAFSGAGTSNVYYQVDPNTSPFARGGSITVDGQVSTITQDGRTCDQQISPPGRAHGFGATSNSFTVNTGAGCNWAASNTNSWITLVGTTSSNATADVGYLLTDNLSLQDRIGIITIESHTFIVTQAASGCSIHINPGQRTYSAVATNGTVDVSTAGGCIWLVSTPDTWINILSGSSGNGVGTVSYSILQNVSSLGRTGSIAIGDQTFVINQASTNCAYKLSTTSRSHGFGANTNSIGVTTGPNCTWSVLNTNNWISIDSINGTPPTNFIYSILPNFGSTTRTGFIYVADQVLTLQQSPSTNGFSFESLTVAPSGDITLRLNGGPPGIWQLQSSANLQTWFRYSDLTNTTGRVEFSIPAARATNHFYRAILP